MKDLIHIKRKDHDFQMCVRPGTTDEKVVDEVIYRNVYEKPSIGFRIEKDDKWLDLGANIGTFTLLCLSRGASVIAYEPEKSNYELLRKNIEMNYGKTRRCRTIRAAVGIGAQKTIDLFLAKDENNKYRHSLYKKRGRSAIRVPHRNIDDVLQRWRPTAIKMDIEGSEIDILEHLTDYTGIQKLVFEYSFDIDKSIPRFLAIIARLRRYFKVVHYTRVNEKDKEYRFYPAMTIVYCLKN